MECEERDWKDASYHNERKPQNAGMSKTNNYACKSTPFAFTPGDRADVCW